jgi:hypothetical protein
MSSAATCLGVHGTDRRTTRLLFGALVSAVLLVLPACGGGNANNFGTGGGGDTPTTVTASDLLITLSSSSLTNSGSDSITVTVTAVDASRVALANVPVTISADNNAVVVAAASKTAATTGRITATVATGTDRSNRIVTVTATNGTLSRSASFAVVGAKISASVLQAVIAPGGAGRIDYRVTDVNSNPMTGMAFSVSAPGLTTANGVTDTNGSYTFNYVAPATTGNLDITANSGGVELVQTIIVQAGSGSIPAVTTPINSASVSANPSVVSVNTAASNNRTEIRALFLGAGNLPIPNVRVKFDLAGDVNSIGGALSSANNVVFSDASGVAATAYIPGTRSSPTDGVSVRACYYLDDTAAAAGGCANFTTTTLTVISEPLAVSIGTDNTISEADGGLTYVKKFVVLVVDASGQAKAGVQVTPSIDLTGYSKGFYVIPGAWTTARSTDPTVPSGYASALCANEDLNRNGVNEVTAGVPEDINGNGQLDPRKSDVAISLIGTGTTDATGVATLQIKYAKSVATWVSFRILISASGISGTEGRTSYSGILPAAATEFTAQADPSFKNSPYGRGNPARSTATECSSPD